MASHLSSVQVKAREKATAELCTHCNAHIIKLVLKQSAKFLPECTSFFKASGALATFFHHSTKRTQFLDEIERKRIPKAARTRWSSNSKLIKTILQYHGDLCKLFSSMNNNPNLCDTDTLVRSNGFYEWLIKDSTYYYLMVYNEIFIKTDTLFHVYKPK